MVSRGSSIILKTPESITMNTKEQTVESPLVSEKDSSIDDREGGPTDDGTIDTNSDPVIVSRCSSTILKTPESIIDLGKKHHLRPFAASGKKNKLVEISRKLPRYFQ